MAENGMERNGNGGGRLSAQSWIQLGLVITMMIAAFGSAWWGSRMETLVGQAVSDVSEIKNLQKQMYERQLQIDNRLVRVERDLQGK